MRESRGGEERKEEEETDSSWELSSLALDEVVVRVCDPEIFDWEGSDERPSYLTRVRTKRVGTKKPRNARNCDA